MGRVAMLLNEDRGRVWRWIGSRKMKHPPRDQERGRDDEDVLDPVHRQHIVGPSQCLVLTSLC